MTGERRQQVVERVQLSGIVRARFHIAPHEGLAFEPRVLLSTIHH